MRTNCIESVLPVVYKKGNNFEILPELDLARKDEVWGYQIMPGIILAKKCGTDGNVRSTTWDNVKYFAENCRLNGKSGKLPSKDVLKQNWSEELRANIKQMDAFLCENGIDAERDYIGYLWCSEVYERNSAYCFSLYTGNDDWLPKNYNHRDDRFAVAF